MTPYELRRIIPLPPPEVEATLAAYQTTSQFYRELHTRQENLRYCDWYYTTVARHQQELQQMRSEFNIMSLFRRRR